MDSQKLAKVLALAASDNESEAVQALRTAKRLLESQGGDFVELAQILAQGLPYASASPDFAAETEALEDEVFDLRNEIRHLRAEIQRLRQDRSGSGPAAAAPSLAEASRDAAALIRLRAQVVELSALLDAEQCETQRLRGNDAQARATSEASKAEAKELAARLRDNVTRRMRLEAENRRLTHANHALTVELAEISAHKDRLSASLAAQEVERGHDGALSSAKRMSSRGKTRSSVSQYALF